MNHPTPEAWMAYLYHETSVEIRADSEAHLAVCPQCREQINAWRGTLGVLDRDDLVNTRPTCASLPSARPSGRTHPRFPLSSWAIAAGLVALVGVAAGAFLTGRGTGLSQDQFQSEVAKLRTDLTREITENLHLAHQRDLSELAAATVRASADGQRELVTSLAANFDLALNAARMNDRREFVAAFERLDRRRAKEFAAMRDSFQVLAEKTGGAFRETDTRLNALANALPAPEPDVEDTTP